MFDVASRAVRRINLFRMMDGPVVAVETGGVRHFGGKCACRSQVACSAIFFQHRMRFAHAAAGVDAMITRKAAPGNPNHGKQRQREAKPEFGALQRCRPFEIVEVNALRELFCCTCSCHSSLATSLIAERHDCVNSAEQNQCQRKRDVQQQPAVQPVMQTFLTSKLPRFVANVFKIREC
jgi:hypothetical protein